MMKINKKRKICLICEDQEEQYYVEALIKKAVFSDKYEFKITNAKGISSIFSRYQEKYQSDSYSLVLVFCDTDKESKKQYYKELKKKINDFHDNDVANKIIIFGNPCTMQIILSHFADIKLKSQSKKENSNYIEEYTGIKKYDAKEEQVKELMSKITRKNYETMKNNISKISTNDKEKPSTNILYFLNNLEKENMEWIEEINKNL